MECGTMFVSGSMDRTARLWEVDSGACLQTFVGHSAGVSSVAAVDEVTLLTGSIDTTLKLWDALRGICLRTYWGHASIVTGVSVTDDDTTFVTSSVDRTINVWVLTALPADIDPHKTIDNAFDTSDGFCRGYEPE
jgi:WD40 repeat protein